MALGDVVGLGWRHSVMALLLPPWDPSPAITRPRAQARGPGLVVDGTMLQSCPQLEKCRTADTQVPPLAPLAAHTHTHTAGPLCLV